VPEPPAPAPAPGLPGLSGSDKGRNPVNGTLPPCFPPVVSSPPPFPPALPGGKIRYNGGDIPAQMYIYVRLSQC